MRKTAIAILTAIPLAAIGAYAFAEGTTSTDDRQVTAAPTNELAQTDQSATDDGLFRKKLTLGDFSMEDSEEGEGNEGYEDGE